MKSLITILGAGMIAVGAAGLAEAAPIVTDGLVAAYEFGGNADDSSGNGNNGTVYGATLTIDRYGNADSAYSFNSENSNYIGIADSVSLDQTTFGALSVASMVNFGKFMPINSTEGQTVLGKWGIQPVSYILYRGSDNALIWNLNNDPDTIAVAPLPTESNAWYHIIGTADSDSIRLYIDGNLVASSRNGIAQINASANTLRIGYEESGPSPLSGVIDHVYIYNRALSNAEVGMLYAAAVPEPESYALMLVGSGIVGFVVRRRASGSVAEVSLAK
jgi:hypothetical protein